MLAQANPTRIIEKIKDSLFGIKYIEINPIPPRHNERACVFLLPISLAIYGKAKATIAETRL
jgi:hypothetical protein